MLTLKPWPMPSSQAGPCVNRSGAAHLALSSAQRAQRVQLCVIAKGVSNVGDIAVVPADMPCVFYFTNWLSWMMGINTAKTISKTMMPMATMSRGSSMVASCMARRCTSVLSCLAARSSITGN